MPEQDPIAVLAGLGITPSNPGGGAPAVGAPPAVTGGTSGFDPYGTGAAIVGKIKGQNLAGWDDPIAWNNTAAAYWGIEVQDDGNGEDRGLRRHAEEYPETQSQTLPGKRPVEAIMQKLMGMSSRERILLQAKLKKAGYLGDFRPGAADDKTINALSEVLLETAREGIATGESTSWQEYLDQRITDAESELAKAAATTTETSTSITSKESGRGVIWEAFRDAVGRDPSETEIDKFMAKLNAQERANPSVTTQTTDSGGNSTSTTTGGFDAAAQSDMVRKEVQGNDQYAEYQAAAFYMPLLFQSLDASTDLEGGL